MASKKKQATTLKAEDVIQAVLLADSFSDSLAPYCWKTSLSLVPLVNVPLLDYALEYLEASGVHECFIYLCRSPDAVKEHLSGSRWLNEDSPMVIQVQTAEDCLSLGDIMRDLDAKSLIQSDFLLMSVDCITNLDIVPMMKEHSARRKSDDRGSVMTLLCREASPRHPARAWDAQLLLAADAETGRVVHHQRLPASPHGRISLPLHIFQQFTCVEVRYDLLDPGLSICSPNVPQLFSDNFDFQTRDHFIKGIIVNEEVLGNTIYYKGISTGYAAQINSLNALETVTRDVMDRWSYPVVPETRAPTRSDIRCLQRNVYRHKASKVGERSRLEGTVSLGAGVEVGRDCRLVRSVVGAGCRLGDGVELEDAVLDVGCRLDSGVRLSRAVLGTGVQLGAGVVLEPGCVLGAGVRVEGPTTLPAGTLLTAEPQEEAFGGRPRPEAATELVGAGGRGFVYTAEEADDPLRPAPLGPAEPPPAVLSDDDSESEEDEDEDGEFGDGAVIDDTKLFYNEVLDSLVRGYHEKIRPENLILEVNSSKFAYNVTVQELNALLVKAILSVPESGCDEPLPAPAFLAKLSPVLSSFQPLLANYIKSEESERSCLKALEAFSYEHEAMAACLAKVLMVLYQRDILSENAILAWYSEAQEQTPSAARVRQRVRGLIEWLEQADEESDSDEDST